MNDKTSENPFAPGPGMPPFHLAGRAMETGVLAKTLTWARSAAGKGKGYRGVVGAPVALVGPRGIGKTALLKWGFDKAESMGFHAIEILPGQFNDLGQFISLVCPPDALSSVGRAARRLGIKSAGIPGVVRVEGSGGDVGNQTLLKQAMVERTKLGPLLLVLDEAHQVIDEGFRDFIMVVLSLIGDKHPIALFLAGAPDLRMKIRGSGTTFVERIHFQEFNLLSDEESRDCFTKTFAAGDRVLQRGALAKMVDWADNYPFFVQLLGHWTWEALGHSKASISAKDVQKGLAIASKYRNGFYWARRQELRKGRILDQATEVIRILKKYGGEILDVSLNEELTDALQRNPIVGADAGSLKPGPVGGSKEQAYWLEEKLVELGFLYQDETQLSPGIPSLFGYIEDKKPKPRASASRKRKATKAKKK